MNGFFYLFSKSVRSIAICIGEIIDRGLKFSLISTASSNNPYKLDYLLSDRMGNKLEILEKILKYNDAETANLIIGQIIPLGAIKKLRSLNSGRNNVYHSNSLEESQAEDACNSLIAIFKDLLFELKKLEFVSLIQFKGELNDEKIIFWKFTGHSLKRTRYSLDVDGDFINKNIGNLGKNRLFCQFNDRIICLSPFAHVYIHDHEQCIAFYKKRKNNKYLFEVTHGSSLNVEIEKSIFDKSIQAIKALLL